MGLEHADLGGSMGASHPLQPGGPVTPTPQPTLPIRRRCPAVTSPIFALHPTWCEKPWLVRAGTAPPVTSCKVMRPCWSAIVSARRGDRPKLLPAARW